MNKSKSSILLLSALSMLWGCAATKIQDMNMPEDKMGLRYRIEMLDVQTGTWKVIDQNKGIQKTEDIRFRFMSNVAGTLYMLNSSDPNASLQPIFYEGKGEGLRSYLGLGTPIGAGEVGIFPNPEKGGGLRFVGVQGKERFLMTFVPDHLGKRDVMAIPAGAEGWDFEAETTYMAIGDPGYILFHYLEMKSK